MFYRKNGKCGKTYCDGESMLNWVIERWENMSKWVKMCKKGTGFEICTGRGEKGYKLGDWQVDRLYHCG